MPYQIIEARTDTELITKLTAAINGNLLPVGSVEYSRGVWYVGVQTGTASAPAAVVIVACPDSIRLNNNVNLQLVAGYATLGSTVMRNGQYVQVMTKGVPATGGGGGTITGLVAVDPQLTYTGTGPTSQFILTSTASPSPVTITSNAGSSSIVANSTLFSIATLTANVSISSGVMTIGGGGILAVQGTGGIGVRPTANNNVSCGTAAMGWTAVYAQSATITPSDERLKENIAPITDAVLDAWATVEFCTFTFKDGGVRTHMGVIAQRVMEAFTNAGLDPTKYALFCYDSWDAVPDEIVDDEVVAKGYPAGDRYAIRYEEALVLEAALMRRTVSRLTQGG